MDVSSVADVEGPSVRTVRAVAVLDSVLKQKLWDSRRLLLGEQLLDAHLSVRFSSFNTLSFFKT